MSRTNVVTEANDEPFLEKTPPDPVKVIGFAVGMVAVHMAAVCAQVVLDVLTRSV